MTEQPARPARRRGAGALAVVTALLVVAAGVALWTQRTVLDTDRFVAVAGPVLDHPDVTQPLADPVSTAVVDALAVDQLPASVEGALEGEIDRLVADAVDSEPVRELLRGLVTRAHAATVGLARGERDEHAGVALGDGGLVLEMRPAVVAALDTVTQDLGAIGRLLPDLLVPEDAGRVVLLRNDVLQGVERFVDGVDRAVPVLLVGAAAGVVLTLGLASRRRRALTQLGLAVAVTAALAALASVPLRDALAGRPDPALRRAARALLEPLGSDLTGMLVLVAVVGAGAAVLGWLAGRVGPR